MPNNEFHQIRREVGRLFYCSRLWSGSLPSLPSAAISFLSLFVNFYTVPHILMEYSHAAVWKCRILFRIDRALSMRKIYAWLKYRVALHNIDVEGINSLIVGLSRELSYSPTFRVRARILRVLTLFTLLLSWWIFDGFFISRSSGLIILSILLLSFPFYGITQRATR